MSLQGKFAVPLFVVLSFFMLSVFDFDLVQAEEPTSEEQLFIFELNRARYNPTQFQTENSLSVDLSYVAAQPPLAVNGGLTGSAGFKAQEMADNNYFAHESPISGWPNALARSFGYNLASKFNDNANNIESIAAGFDSVIDYTQPLAPLVLLIVDEGVPSLGHRNHLLGIGSFWQQFREIGVGYGSNSSSNARNYWAIHTGLDDIDEPFLTGVVYNDANGNSRFDLNEGLSGVTVSVGSLSTTTNSAGGWSIRTSSGSETVQCNGGSFVGTGTANVYVSSDNVEVDFISGNSAGIVNFGFGVPTVLPTAAITANGSGSSVSINAGEQLTISISLSPGSSFGSDADWWLVVETPVGAVNHYDLTQGVFTTGLLATYEGMLFDLASYAVSIDTSSLATGTYTYSFGVDLSMNGSVDFDKLHFDSVVVNITP